MFAFAIIMTAFAVPEEQQYKVLTFGIALALGAALISMFSLLFFGLLLIYTAMQLFRHRNEDPDVENNAAA